MTIANGQVQGGDCVAAAMTDYVGRVTISDGAWGTQLDERGCPPGYCREEWNLSNVDVVRAVALAYVEAGSQIISTNTLMANRIALAAHGLEGKAPAFCEAGARLSREAAGDRAKVFASMGPTGKILMVGEITERDAYDAFAEQARAFEAGGADAVVVESMSELAEAVAAVRAVRDSTSLPVVASMTFDSGPDQADTMMGVSPVQAATALSKAGAEMIGCNCGVGVEIAIKVAGMFRQASDLPLWVKPNAGLPELLDGHVVYKETPAAFAGKLGGLIAAGANVIGGCCGTSPAHIAAMVSAVGRRGY